MHDYLIAAKFAKLLRAEMLCKKAQKLICAFLHNITSGFHHATLAPLQSGNDRSFFCDNNRMFVLGNHAFFRKEGPVIIFNLENFLFEC